MKPTSTVPNSTPQSSPSSSDDNQKAWLIAKLFGCYVANIIATSLRRGNPKKGILIIAKKCCYPCNKKMKQMNNIAEKIFNEVYQRCNTVFPCGISDAFLYGSYARGDYDDESDIDIMLVVDLDYLSIEKYSNSISEIASDLSLENDLLVSITVKPLLLFNKYSSVLPYYKNVLSEGIRYVAK